MSSNYIEVLISGLLQRLLNTLAFDDWQLYQRGVNTHGPLVLHNDTFGIIKLKLRVSQAINSINLLYWKIHINILNFLTR